VLAIRPNGPAANSQGREPLVAMSENQLSPNGATVPDYCRPVGAFVSMTILQGLTPLAIDDRRVAAREFCYYLHNPVLAGVRPLAYPTVPLIAVTLRHLASLTSSLYSRDPQLPWRAH
jgi:hypothetical protein